GLLVGGSRPVLIPRRWGCIGRCFLPTRLEQPSDDGSSQSMRQDAQGQRQGRVEDTGYDHAPPEGEAAICGSSHSVGGGRRDQVAIKAALAAHATMELRADGS